MHRRTRYWLILIVVIIAIKLFSFFPFAVERYYSEGLYPVVSGALRIIFGWIPFSIGDMLYTCAGLFLIFKLVRMLRAIFQKKAGRQYWWNGLRWLVFYALFVYAIFNIFWGLNYNRVGLGRQLGLDMRGYTTAELATVMQVVVQRLDSTYQQGLAQRNKYAGATPLFHESLESYQLVQAKNPQLSYRFKSVKSSLFGSVGDYLGYSGYYNPFTGEAQVNTTVPVFIQPFTTCHEMGHQLGYAKENEANFAGYLSAKASQDAAFRYSVYFDMYSYGIRELYGRDTTLALAISRQKPLQVKKDLETIVAFYDQYQNPVEPYIRKLYDQYLKANEQPSGMRSYNEVMAFLVGYYKKFGPAAL